MTDKTTDITPLNEDALAAACWALLNTLPSEKALFDHIKPAMRAAVSEYLRVSMTAISATESLPEALALTMDKWKAKTSQAHPSDAMLINRCIQDMSEILSALGLNHTKALAEIQHESDCVEAAKERIAKLEKHANELAVPVQQEPVVWGIFHGEENDFLNFARSEEGAKCAVLRLNQVFPTYYKPLYAYPLPDQAKDLAVVLDEALEVLTPDSHDFEWLIADIRKALSAYRASKKGGAA